MVVQEGLSHRLTVTERALVARCLQIDAKAGLLACQQVALSLIVDFTMSRDIATLSLCTEAVSAPARLECHAMLVSGGDDNDHGHGTSNAGHGQRGRVAVDSCLI